MACISGILMAAFTAGLVIADLWFWRSGRIVPHVFLGGIVTALFFALCQYGYELVNWSLLGLLLVSFLISIFRNVFNSDSTSDSEDDKEEYPCQCRKLKLAKCGCIKKNKCA